MDVPGSCAVTTDAIERPVGVSTKVLTVRVIFGAAVEAHPVNAIIETFTAVADAIAGFRKALFLIAAALGSSRRLRHSVPKSFRLGRGSL